MSLATYLQRAGVTTGPLVKNTSHSGLDVIKKLLLGEQLFRGGEEFLQFGSALHERWLEGNFKREVLPKQVRVLVAAYNALQSDKFAMKLLTGSTREEKLYTKLNGVEISFILDIHRKAERVGADLKTTGVRCLAEFVDKARQYGYFRQAVTYMKAANLKTFYFIAVTKTTAPKVFIFCVNDYPEELAYAERELEFLLYFYKHYGTFQLP